MLEWLDSHVTGGPKLISEDAEIDYAREHISRRLSLLKDAKLIKRHQRGAYTLADLGAQYLAETVDLREDDTPDENAARVDGD